MDDLIRLETKIAYQDNMIHELNNVVIEQQKKIDLLVKEIFHINEKLLYIKDNNIKDLSEEEPPPHY